MKRHSVALSVMVLGLALVGCAQRVSAPQTAVRLGPLPAYTHEASLALRGWAAPGTVVSHGPRSTVATGEFCLTVPLEIGFNLVAVRAELGGSVRSGTVPVIRTAAPMRHYRAAFTLERAC